jgi:hypothetical protein
MIFKGPLKLGKIALGGLKALFVFFVGWLGWGVFDSIINKEALIKSLSKVPSIIWNIKVPNIFFILVLVIIICTLVIFGRRFKWLTVEKFKEMLADNQRMQRHNDQLVEKMNDFFTNYIKLSKEDRSVLDRIKPLVDRILQNDIIIENNAVWIIDKITSRREGPFCIRCHSADNKLIPMLESKTVYDCPVCKLDVEKNFEDLSEEHEFILLLLAEAPDKSGSFDDLSFEYEKKFKKKGASLNLILNKLIEYRLIKEIGYGDFHEIGYEIIPKGMMYLEKRVKSNSPKGV